MEPALPDLRIESLGPCRHDVPTNTSLGDLVQNGRYVDDGERILLNDCTQAVAGRDAAELPSFELAGPRRKIFFDPNKTKIGIVTCGGLCPGINDVIRGLVMASHHRYGVRKAYGFRFGFEGFISSHGHEVLELTPQLVSDIHEIGGTFLGTSRGQQDVKDIVACLENLGVNVLFVIGGDGTIRGALAIGEEVERQGLKISVVGVPKTIDNDIAFIDQSFGFETAFTLAEEALLSAHNEARGAVNGVGLVKLMGRESGFIACHATLASSHANFVLIPEVPFELDGENGFLAHLERRVRARKHAVIVAAEGAGQHLMNPTGKTDPSGNRLLADVGGFLSERIKAHFKQVGLQLNLRYIDPSYLIRSVSAIAPDSVYCWRLAQNAVHAAMAGKTKMIIGQWHQRMVHIPMKVVTSGRKTVDPDGDLWASVLEATGQPRVMG